MIQLFNDGMKINKGIIEHHLSHITVGFLVHAITLGGEICKMV